MIHDPLDVTLHNDPNSGIPTGDIGSMNTSSFKDVEPWMIDFKNFKLVIIPTQVNRRLDIDMNDLLGKSGGAIRQRVLTFTSGDATPSVKNTNLCITAGTTTITAFDDGTIGQVIYIKATASITVSNGASILLAGAANYAMTANDTLTLALFTTGVWVELGRSVN